LSNSGRNLANDPSLSATYAPVSGSANYPAKSKAGRATYAAIDALSLRPWHAALGSRATAPADIVCLGDSVTEGYWADTYGSRWVDVLRTNMQTRFPGPDASLLYTAAGSKIVLTGTTAYTGTGGPGQTSSATTQTMALTDVGSGFDITYIGGGGTGTMALTIDSGTPVTFNTSLSPDGTLGVYKIRGLPVTSHTVQVNMASGSVNAVILKSIRTYTGPKVKGGTGYHPAYHVSGEFTGGPVSRSGAPALNSTYGLGARTALLKATTDVLTNYDEVTAVDILYTLQASADPFLLSIDGAAAVSVPTVGTAGTTGRYQIVGLSPGMHTIKVTGNGGTIGADIQGFFNYNLDETSNVRVWEGGHSGADTGGALAQPAALAPLSTIQPSLVIVGLGINDFGVGNGVPLATYKSNLLGIISNIRAQVTVPPAIALIAYYEPASVTPTSPWSAYVQTLYDIAAADTGITVLDIRQRINTGAPSTLGGMIKTDLIHPLNPGHRYVGDLLTALISPQ
jgi:lysophospholipase L1-like esterase